ncbi:MULTISPECIES: type II toxin-antitoxin system prevent-host-death family antitoxin [unclassified Arthrobacter]|jgi:prevent-host-death family protein|uniref:type II toxin-antitoxin system Phd/YefM family antitoxin n=1 Tax=unclassified Arthrobacter TaxID=235627 RepID=UPI002225B823|nr:MULTISPECIES: type II toxin-antitoxin system prevent-host-death family antitoxin [unclassified Arthrobacter]UYY81101.1 type II toxin-antitoxin system prevent-host-death family antitoxin [Arthrobacter sp. YA7-1]
MGTVTVRELRNHGDEVLERVARGETLIVTREDHEVAELQPVRRRGRQTEQLIASRRHLPRVDIEAFRADLD